MKPFRFYRVCTLVLSALMLVACGDDEQASTEKGKVVVPVTVAIVEVRDVQTQLRSIGRLVSRNAPMLASEVSARVVEVMADEGEAVVRGQVRLRLDTTAFELARREARAAIEQLTVSIANEERRVARYRDLKTTNAMSQERLDDAEAKLASDRAAKVAAEARLAIAEDRLAKAELVSPLDGVIERRHVSVGDYARPGDPLFSVTDTQKLRVQLPFPETVAHQLQPGQRIILESMIAPGLKHEVSIEQLRPQVGGTNRALMAVADVENPGPWRPGATVAGDVVVDQRPDTLVVPYVSLVERPAGMVVYVVNGPDGDTVSQRVVEPGERQNGTIEIRSGLEPGQVVVRDGAAYLSDGAHIAVRGGES